MAVFGQVYGSERVEARIRDLGKGLRQSLVSAMRAQWFALQSYIVTSKLSGQVLRRVTGNLASSINVGGPSSLTTFEDLGAQIVGRVGTAVRYAGAHEYGGTFRVREYQRKITQVFGRPVTPTEVFVAAHTVTFPERSFLRSGLADRSAQIRAAIAASVREELSAI